MTEPIGLEEPLAAAGVVPGGAIPRSHVAVEVRVPVPDTGPHPLNDLPRTALGAPPAPQPRSFEEQIADVVGVAMTQQFALREDQQRALRVAKEIDTENHDGHRKKVVGWISGILLALGGVGGGGGYYLNREEGIPPAAVETTEALRRQDVEVRLDGVEHEVGELQIQTKEIDTALGGHIDDQRTVNEAQRLSGARREIMLETLIRAEGRRPPLRTTGPSAVLGSSDGR